MTERLEEIKEAYRWTIDNSLVPRLSDSDTEWLIEQAERVQDLKIMLKVLGEENQRYKQALEFYADEEHYKENLISKAEQIDGNWVEPAHYEPPIIYFDSGEKARQALEVEE